MFKIDKENKEKIKNVSWYLNSSGYVAGYRNGRHIKMHQLILGKKEGFDIDHINGDKADNRKSNLQHITHSQNIFKAKIPTTNKSGAKGVHWGKHINKWIVEIGINKKTIYLGSFSSKKEAIIIRKEAELKYYPLDNLKF